jgi:16S rRNA (cytosine1402-N4)-methyltransferase
MWPQINPEIARKPLREKAYAAFFADFGVEGMTSDPDGPAVAGGSARHIPVLAGPAIELLDPCDGGVYIDGTFGAGGYTRAILGAANSQVIAIDRDQSALAQGMDLVQSAGGRLTLVEQQFSVLDRVAEKFGHIHVDGVVLDLGVSSMQLDQAERGFSFRSDGPLDMRMGGDGPSAVDVIAQASERDLADIIFQLGEERHSRAVARAIVAARKQSSIQTTLELANIVARVVRVKPGQIHPATRTFQALRIFVNEELAELAAALAAAERILKSSGRIVVVTFHSLEDRIVKTFLGERSRTTGVSRHVPDVEAPAPTFRLLTKRPMAPDEAEIARNPRARSAKLRAGERTDAPPRETSLDHLLPRLPSLADVLRGG